MEIYTTSFTYPRRARLTHSRSSSLDFSGAPQLRRAESYSTFEQYANNSNLSDSQGTASPSDYDAVQKLAMMAMGLHGVHISFSAADQGRAWSFQISGAYQQVMLARGLILKECPIQNRSTIKVAGSEILDGPSSKPSLKPEVRRRLDDIASQTLAHIAVVNSPLSSSTRNLPDGISSSTGWSGLETERVCELVITGPGDSVDLARVRLLVMLDELSGLHAEACEIDRTLHAVIAGRKRAVVQSIQEETATNIYFPSPLQGVIGPEIGQSAPNASPTSQMSKINANTIWITGEFFGVQRARDMLFQVSMSKSKQILSRDSAMLARKMDWMITERADDLKALMHDNATYIQFPPVGSSASLVTVFGDHRVNIQRTIRSIMQLVCISSLCEIFPSFPDLATGVPVLHRLIVATPRSI